MISISLIRREHDSELDSRAYEAVKGSLSTKIEAVVKTLIRIQVKPLNFVKTLICIQVKP
jgi:hypothetical protein